MIEFNLDDVKELRRVTEIEMSGQLDSDGLKAFVEAPRFIYLSFYLSIYLSIYLSVFILFTLRLVAALMASST